MGLDTLILDDMILAIRSPRVTTPQISPSLSTTGSLSYPSFCIIEMASWQDILGNSINSAEFGKTDTFSFDHQ